MGDELFELWCKNIKEKKKKKKLMTIGSKMMSSFGKLVIFYY